MSLEMAHKGIVPQKKNYVPQFLKQRAINSFFITGGWLIVGIFKGWIELTIQNGPLHKIFLRGQKSLGPLKKSRFCAGTIRIFELAPFIDLAG